MTYVLLYPHTSYPIVKGEEDKYYQLPFHMVAKQIEYFVRIFGQT